MPRMSKKRKQEWALFLNERNRITVGGLCRKCRNDCKPPAALTEPAEQVPKGAKPARHWLSLPLWKTQWGACFLCRLPPPPLACFFTPYPPAPFPGGEGGDF